MSVAVEVAGSAPIGGGSVRASSRPCARSGDLGGVRLTPAPVSWPPRYSGWILAVAVRRSRMRMLTTGTQTRHPPGWLDLDWKAVTTGNFGGIDRGSPISCGDHHETLRGGGDRCAGPSRHQRRSRAAVITMRLPEKMPRLCVRPPRRIPVKARHAPLRACHTGGWSSWSTIYLFPTSSFRGRRRLRAARNALG